MRKFIYEPFLKCQIQRSSAKPITYKNNLVHYVDTANATDMYYACDIGCRWHFSLEYLGEKVVKVDSYADSCLEISHPTLTCSTPAGLCGTCGGS